MTQGAEAKGAAEREQKTRQGLATQGRQAHPQSPGKQDECDECRASHCADHQGQNQNHLMLSPSQFREAIRKPDSQPTRALGLNALTHLHKSPASRIAHRADRRRWHHRDKVFFDAWSQNVFQSLSTTKWQTNYALVESIYPSNC